jgi:hydroxypyruvate reductase
MKEKNLTGWVNVPADCVRPLQRIHLHPARLAGVNEPTAEGEAGAAEILRLVSSLGPEDLCLCLISGGGSALLPAPIEGITLADKLAVTRHLSAAGANIEQLNQVRKQLSRIKGGGLLRACRAGKLVSLIISDVLGDPLDVIASGPTVPDTSTPKIALAVLEQFHAHEAGISPAVFDVLRQASEQTPATSQNQSTAHCTATNLVIGNNATAVEAAAQEAKRLGYAVTYQSASQSEGFAEEIGRQLATAAIKIQTNGEPACLITGGEPVVKLVEASQRGLGGRNQQLVLAALEQLTQTTDDRARHIALLSGGTDGEDGPTDAAGAVLDAEIMHQASQKRMNPQEYLSRNDAYHFFEPLDALLRTGPTNTNVCDLRVVVTAKSLGIGD